MTAPTLDRSLSPHDVQVPARLAGRPPRPLLVVAVVALLAGVAMLFTGALKTGVTTDEPYHVQRFEHYLDSGWYIVDFQTVGGQPAKGVTDQYVYGPATMGLLHGWNRLLRIDGPGEVSTTATAYAARHLGVALLSLLAVAGVAAITRIITRSWGWGLVAAAVLCATPMWLGHSMFNVKDPSVGAGYTLVTLALLVMARAHRGSVWRSMAASLTLAAGTWLAVGTRPGMWAAVLASTVAFVVLTLLRRRAPGESWGWWRVGELTAGLAAAALLLWWLYPNVFGDPLTMLMKSTSNSANFLGIESSRLFVPLHVLLLMPILILAFEVVGVLSGLGQLVRSRLRTGPAATGIALVGVQLVTLPAITVIHPSGLYSDLRQFLFGAPPAAVFATIGIGVALDRAARESDRRVSVMALAAGCLAVAVPLVDQATLFPYNYAYYNAFVDAAGLRSIAPLDYSKASMRELVPDIPDGKWGVCNPLWLDDRTITRVATLDGAIDCATAETSPVSAYLQDRSVDTHAPSPTAFWALMVGGKVPSNCTPVADVTRRHGWRRLTMSTLADCHMVAQTLSDEAVADQELLAPYFVSGFYLRGRTYGGEAVVAFVPDEHMRTAPLSLELGIDQVVDLTAKVDGHGVQPRVQAGKVLLPLPQEAVAAATEQTPIIVELATPDGGPLDVTLTSLGLSVTG